MAETWDVVVIGAGAAGLLAAARAAARGRRVLLLEKNRKAGVKILMSGGTRCNLTHAVEAPGIVAAFGKQGRFLHSALAALGPAELVQLVERCGVETKVESTGKIFPASDKAADVAHALVRLVRESRVTLALGEGVTSVGQTIDGFLVGTSARQIRATKLVITTGGQSYPGCGTTGDGYGWAAHFGHAIVRPRPALVPVKIRADWAKSLRGITVPDVAVRLLEVGDTTEAPRRLGAARRGSFLFAHFGLTGPANLDISGDISRHSRPRSLVLECDFLPMMPERPFEQWLRETATTDGKRNVAVLLSRLLPRRLADSLTEQAEVPADQRAAGLSREQRRELVRRVKATVIPVTGTLGFEKAEVTAGGVALDEIDSRTMQSRRVPNVYVAGELLDLDGPIGGYNFQAAFSTGWLAGESV